MDKKKNILITGGAGYIGSSLATFLLSKNYNVTVIDTLKYSKISLSHLLINKNFKFVYGDVRNKKLLKKLINENQIIIPLAALVGAPLCEKNKKLAKEINLKNIEFIVKNLSKKHQILYPTTNSGYGIGLKNKFCDENSPLNPISLYGRTKVDAEKIVHKFDNSICFRLATVFGVSYRMRSDLLVNNFVYRAIKFKKLDLFEPNFRRNFIHIHDVVRAFYFAIKNFKRLRGNIYNLGLSNANLSKLMLAKIIKKEIKNLKITLVKNKKDPDKRDYYVSNRKIEKKGFKPIVNLSDGVKELNQYFTYNKSEIKNNY
jgi:nucleoside-diphosphate-sugar epimerase